MANRESGGYADIAKDAYDTFVHDIEATNARTVDYLRAIFEVVARPYSPVSIDAVASESIARTNELASLTFEALAAGNRAAAQSAISAGRIAADLTEAHVQNLRGVAETSVSNLAFVRDAASERVHSN